MTPAEAERRIRLHGSGRSPKSSHAEAAAAIAEVVRLARIEEMKNVEGWLISEKAMPVGQFQHPRALELVAERLAALRKPDGGEGETNVKEES